MEKESKNRQRVIDDMMALMKRSETEGLVWRSSKTDLMEMTHILYDAELVRDTQGLPVTFQELVRRVCAIVHVAVPGNPNHLVSRARQRKGRRMLPLLVRYEGMFI